MTGPRRLVVLDGVPRHQWRLDRRSAALWRGRLWYVEPTKCAVCIRAGDDTSVTFVTTDVQPILRCVEHGELAKIAFVVKRMYSVALGQAVVEGATTCEDVVFIPEELSYVEYNALTQTLLAEAEAYEAARGAT